MWLRSYIEFKMRCWIKIQTFLRVCLQTGTKGTFVKPTPTTMTTTTTTLATPTPLLAHDGSLDKENTRSPDLFPTQSWHFENLPWVSVWFVTRIVQAIIAWLFLAHIMRVFDILRVDYAVYGAAERRLRHDAVVEFEELQVIWPHGHTLT